MPRPLFEAMKTPATTQKLRGGYYTPAPIARFLAEWAIQDAADTVLEPSCGDGNLLEAAVVTLLDRGAAPSSAAAQIQGVEIDRDEAEKAIQRLADYGVEASDRVHIGDFFAYCQENLLMPVRVDAILGNPPFIRYQNFQENHRAIAMRLMEHVGLKPTRLTNAWAPFLVASTLMLSEHGGRIAMVIPAELMQVGYAAELRQFLSNFYSRITLITFRKLLFDGVQQEVVLFLGERNGNQRTGIRTIELQDTDDLAKHEHTDFLSADLKVMDHSKDKWTQYFLDQDEIDLLRDLRQDKRVTLARDVIDVDVGIVTGLNEFFVMTQPQTAARQLECYTRPIVTRSAHLTGLRFTDADLAANTDRGLPSLLLNAPDAPPSSLPEAVKRYVAWGEANGFHTGYKCRIRQRWYVVPSLWTPDAFLLRQIHGYPKIVLNQTQATSTDTIHRLKFVSSLPKELLCAAFINSLTFCSAEITGRSYGGGVLELEPREAEQLLVPLRNARSLDFEQTHQFVAGGEIDKALAANDRVLLIEGLGLDPKDAKKLRASWLKLRDRRVNRNHHR